MRPYRNLHMSAQVLASTSLPEYLTAKPLNLPRIPISPSLKWGCENMACLPAYLPHRAVAEIK